MVLNLQRSCCQKALSDRVQRHPRLYLLDRNCNDDYGAGRTVVRDPEAQSLVAHHLIERPVSWLQVWPRIKKNVSGSSTERNGPNIFIPISSCAGIDLDRNISRNSERLPGFVLYVRIS